MGTFGRAGWAAVVVWMIVMVACSGRDARQDEAAEPAAAPPARETEPPPARETEPPPANQAEPPPANQAEPSPANQAEPSPAKHNEAEPAHEAPAGEHPQPAAASADPCGEKGQPACPLQGWMERHLQDPADAMDLAKLAQGLARVPRFAPDPSWNEGPDGWSAIAETGAAAAKRGDADAAKQACKTCHKTWRRKYKEQFRLRAIPD